MAKNRLDLNFNIESAQDRQDFINEYLAGIRFTPSQEELETMANYVLYGRKSPSDHFNLVNEKGGDLLSLVDAGYVEIESKRSSWKKKQPESLNNLLEISRANGNSMESQFNMVGNLSGKTMSEPSRIRVKKTVFSRTECAAALLGKEYLLNQFKELWKQIDKVDYLINCYELRVGKRKAEIRKELTAALSAEEKEEAEVRSRGFNMYSISKMRRHLVELRQQQYTWREAYTGSIVKGLLHKPTLPLGEVLEFAAVLPCGIKGFMPEPDFLALLFMEKVSEAHFKPAFQRELLDFLIEKDKGSQLKAPGLFDFTNSEHVALLIYAKKEILFAAQGDIALEEREYISQFAATLDYYIAAARLEPIYLGIIEMKESGMRNEDIAEVINRSYGKTYSPNYISTLFRAKCCGGIAAAAKRHEQIVDKLSAGIEEFKRCNTCHELLLRDADTFVRKARSSDGLSGRCKPCDKEFRREKREREEKKSDEQQQ